MSLFLEDYEGGSGAFDTAPPGSVTGVIGGIYDVGLQDTQYGVKQKIVVAYELDERDSKGRRFVVMTPYNRTIHPKAALRQLVDAVVPDLPPEKRKKFDLMELVGESVLVQVVHTDKGRARAAGVTPMPKGMTPITPEEDYREPFGLASWYLERALTSDQAASSREAEKANAPVPGADDIPF